MIDQKNKSNQDTFLLKIVAVVGGVVAVIIACIAISNFVSSNNGGKNGGGDNSVPPVVTDGNDTTSSVTSADTTANDAGDTSGDTGDVGSNADEGTTGAIGATSATGGDSISGEGDSIDSSSGEVEAQPTLLAESEDMGQEYLDDITFLGDSTTYGLKYYGVLKDGKSTAQVWTPTNGTLTLSMAGIVKILYPETNTEITIKEAVTAKKPKMMVITLGVNGVSFMDKEAFKLEYTKLVNSIKEASPETKIILNSIYPVAANYEHLNSINNGKITSANEWILEIATECGIQYLDTNSVLKDETGNLKTSYQNGDGIHLCAEGFEQVLNYIRTHGYVG